MQTETAAAEGAKLMMPPTKTHLHVKEAQGQYYPLGSSRLKKRVYFRNPHAMILSYFVIVFVLCLPEVPIVVKT